MTAEPVSESRHSKKRPRSGNLARKMRYGVIINSRSGAAFDLDRAEISRIVRSVLGTGDNVVDIQFADPSDLNRLLRETANGPYDIIVIGGGDGSIRAAAQCLISTDKTLAILPLGTLNRLAGDFDLPTHLPDALRTIAGGRIVRIDVGEVNGKIFLCNSILGLPLQFTTQRESLRGRALMDRAAAYAGIVWKMLSSSRRIDIKINEGVIKKSAKVLSVLVTAGEYEEVPSLVLRRSPLDKGFLTLYAALHPNGWAMLRSILRAMTGKWRGDPNIYHVRGESITLLTSKRRIKLSNDGEVETFVPPLRFKIRPKALKISLPRLNA